MRKWFSWSSPSIDAIAYETHTLSAATGCSLEIDITVIRRYLSECCGFLNRSTGSCSWEGNSMSIIIYNSVVGTP